MRTLRLEAVHGLRMQTVDAVAAHAAEAVKAEGLDSASSFAAETVAEELCANVLEHSDASWLQLSIGEHEGHGLVSVIDNGFPFDPAEAIRALQQGFVLAERTDRHLGLYIVQQLSHLVTYRRMNGENHVEVMVVLEDPASQGRQRGQGG